MLTHRRDSLHALGLVMVILFTLALTLTSPSHAQAPATTQPAAATNPSAGPKPVGTEGSYALPQTAQLLAWQALVKPLFPGGVYSLDQFGPIGNPKAAQAAFDAAESHIIGSGGGVLMIPIEVDWTWFPRNNGQHEYRNPPAPAVTKTWREGPGMTIIDLRGPRPTIMPPQITGLTIKRTLDLPPGESLPHWGYYPLLDFQNKIAFGSTSYHDWVQADTTAGPDTKIYVATIRGLFPGMFITANGWSVVERLCIKSLGYDKEKSSWYVVADTTKPISKGTILSNKNHTNIIKMDTQSHNENQTFDLCLWRHNYSQGDNYLIDARFKYTSDIHSTAGDENGVIFAGFVEGHTEAFDAKVDRWDPVTGELRFKDSKDQNTLGSGRPIINLNPKKSISAGHVWIVRPSSYTDDTTKLDNPKFMGSAYPTIVAPNKIGINSLRVGGLIRLSADAPVTKDCVGRYFAVDQSDEYPKGTKVRRWYLIDTVTINADGTKDLRIIRHWWGAKSAGSPTLYNPSNYSYDGHEVPLKYIIAPGVNAFDVSEGLPGGRNYLRLAPSPDVGTPFDFAPGDPIEQAIGPDPFLPTIMRSWTWDKVPSMQPNCYFDIANFGDVQRHTMMRVRGGSGALDKDLEKSWNHTTSFDRIFEVAATSQNAIIFNADVANAALQFVQPHQRAQPIKWNYGDDKPSATTSLTVSPTDGVMTIDAPSVAVPGGLTKTASLSATEKRASNLRGIKAVVKAGSKEVTIKFPVAETDDEYAVFLELSWLTNRAVTEQTAEGFTVKFDTAPATDAKLHWLIVR